MEIGPHPDGIGEQGKSPERLGDHLKLARLLSPQRFPHRAAEMIGIPFEDNQLHGYGVEIQGNRMPLLQMMQGLGLVGASDGVPHLSRGGEITQSLSNAARSYLVEDGYGVKGMGFVHYDTPTSQVGFGLGTRFRRVPSGEDVSGGVEQQIAISERANADALRCIFLLNTGDAPFARVMSVLPYQQAPSYNEGVMMMGDSAVIIREDQTRGVEKKKLVRAIHQALPTLTDFNQDAHACFEGDGHNAFVRDGKVIFTDFEVIGALLDSKDFMRRLGNAWYFEELRKNYPEFLRLYNLTSIDGSPNLGNIDWESIKGKVAKDIENFNIIHDPQLQPIYDALEQGNKEAIMRYAMAGVIASRAHMRQVGDETLTEILRPILNRGLPIMSLKDLQDTLKTIDLTERNFDGESCMLAKDTEGNVIMKININTFGLPINSDIEIPITLADIYRAIEDYSYIGDSIEPPDLGVNEFDHLPNTLLSDTVYAQVAGAFANIKGLQDPHQWKEGRYAGYNTEKLDEGKIDFITFIQPEDLVERVFTVGDEVKVSFVSDYLRVEAPTKLEHFPIAELNKVAYAIHTANQYFQEQGDTSSQVVNISVNK